MKTILAFETSTPFLSVALGNRNGKISEAISKKPLAHSENIIPLGHQLLKKEKLTLSDIDVFAVDRGPGSFTGLRIGFSLLKGFLAVRKRPCFGALSLDIMASKIRLPGNSRLGVVVDARRDLIYSRFYRRRGEEWMPEAKLALLSLSELISQVTNGTVLAGESLGRCVGAYCNTPLPPIKPVFPSARILVEWFYEKNPRLSPLKTSRDFIPLYFRAAKAEEKRRTKGKK
jgi:tRNA threonylcarbamoyl adenosine modification protein YeaZ